MRPIAHLIDQPVLDRVVTNVMQMPLPILLVSDYMLPEATLPYPALAFT